MKVANAAFLIAGEGNAWLTGCAKALLDAHQIVRAVFLKKESSVFPNQV
jgi:hypothetical protein